MSLAYTILEQNGLISIEVAMDMDVRLIVDLDQQKMPGPITTANFQQLNYILSSMPRARQYELFSWLSECKQYFTAPNIMRSDASINRQWQKFLRTGERTLLQLWLEDWVRMWLNSLPMSLKRQAYLNAQRWILVQTYSQIIFPIVALLRYGRSYTFVNAERTLLPRDYWMQEKWAPMSQQLIKDMLSMLVTKVHQDHMLLAMEQAFNYDLVVYDPACKINICTYLRYACMNYLQKDLVTNYPDYYPTC